MSNWPGHLDDMPSLNRWLGQQSTESRIDWALSTLPGTHVLSSSFGVQAAVSLHLLTRHKPDIPVVLVDTGYLFDQTYRFVDDLQKRMDLNLHVVRPELSPAWLEARYGRLWEHGQQGLEQYNHLSKVLPMRAALASLGTGTWIAGLRRAQSRSRATVPFIDHREGRWKLHPLADWSEQNIEQYLKRHDLPRHPLWQQGYVSIGDTHTTHRWQPGMREEDTRFFGIKRECGLHLQA